MSSRVLLLTAEQAIAKAKKNALTRKQKTAKLLLASCFDKINQMVEEGVVSIFVPMNEEQVMWGLPSVKEELEKLGYVINTHVDENSDTPDIEISIEHLK